MRRVRRKGGNKDKVFGCDLLEHLNATGQEIPQVLRCCSDFVEQNGIVDGIYRLSGVSSNIQKLRGEFEGDGTPDLNKDVYLQDIHCVSSLCKAYFRELPNPLLTYQLYDKFAEAVAIQLEEERLVKIRDVLKELPTQHYRTLEFLMRHLVRMASYSSETNMHARNLAIVWAPNLLRSKDIEASGFNGTAAFMEVRVQSIVVEFILTHVAQLFPELGVSNERRNSLPSPVSNQDEAFFRSVASQPVVNFGNISPGDGPLPIRPYHAIIEGTDKRKGSLKGRKWMSIFNIGGRFQDQRRRHKHSTKEKERTPLRPARSMDSLSSPPYPNQGSRHPAQRPPSTNMSAVVTPASQSSSDVTAAPTGAIGGSEYAVTYRRGTGLVSGGAGTQGTYTALDPEGLGVVANEALLSRSPGLSSKAGRRAAMHITGPTMVTVPLHITSNLALGVLQGGGGDRVIHRGRDKDGGDRMEWKEGGEKEEEKNKSRGEKKKNTDDRKDEEEENREGRNKEAAGGGEEEGDKEMMADPGEPRDLSNAEEDHDEDAAGVGQNVEDNDEYMEMKGVESPDLDRRHDAVHDASDILNSTEVVGDDQELSGYVQDNFDFLDQMDCSVPDCSAPYQMCEFSVEPPGHSDDEYAVMEQAQSGPETHTQNQTELKPHRPLSIDLHNRHTKSLSLPYMTSPVHGPEEFSEEEVVGDDSDYHDYSSDEDESMFVKSLPPDFFLQSCGFDPDSDAKDSSSPHRVGSQCLQRSEERHPQSVNLELSACKETTTGDQQQLEENKRDDTDEDTGEKETSEEVHQGQAADIIQSPAPEEQSKDTHSEKAPTSEASPPCYMEFPVLSIEDNNESSTVASMEVEEEKEGVNILLSDDPPLEVPLTTQKETTDVPLEECKDSVEHRGSVSLNSEEEEKETEDTCQQFVLEIKESDEKMCEAPTEGDSAEVADKKHKAGIEKENETGSDVWDVLEDVICEVIEENEQSVPGQAGVVRDGEEQCKAKVSEDKMVEDNEGEMNETEVRTEEEDKTREGKLSEESEEEETHSSERSDLEKSTQEKHVFNEDTAQHRDREVVSKQAEKENDEQHRTQTSTDKQLTERKDLTESRKCEKSDSSLAGVGRTLVISKQPKTYQVKAVPVVPPKPQHCKITALTLRQQQQQRERRDADRGRDNTLRVPTEQEKVCAGEQLKDGDAGSLEKKEKVVLRGGDRERRRDEVATSRNSPLSMCFDEAVAIATMRREKERIREGEPEADGAGK